MANTDEKPKAETSKSLFRDITADDETPEVMEIESLCFKCENNVCFLRCKYKCTVNKLNFTRLL